VLVGIRRIPAKAAKLVSFYGLTMPLLDAIVDLFPLTASPGLAAVVTVLLVTIYLFQINRLLSGTPDEIHRLSPTRWTREVIQETYHRLEERPITTESYVSRLPQKLERRYIVTGGSGKLVHTQPHMIVTMPDLVCAIGLVGGYIVLQLLARGQPPESIRIVDYQLPSRADMLNGPASKVECVRTDISSKASTTAAFSKPWPSSVAHLPLTVFHTAAVIVPSDRSKLFYAFCEAVNVRGTQHVLDAARHAGADVLVSTTSGSISIRPVGYWVSPWKMWTSWPRNYAQVLDESDFFQPLRPHEQFYANYPASKAAAERIICKANSPSLRTGSVRPANGVYGNPTDNTVGGPLNRGGLPQ
jgi:hypothetical protein